MPEVDLLTIRIRPLSAMELVVVRFLSRVADRGPALFRTAVRFRFLRLAMGRDLGHRAAKGLAVAEGAMLLLFVSHPAATPEEMRRKAMLVRAFVDQDTQGNIGAMLLAGLMADADRLGLLWDEAVSAKCPPPAHTDRIRL